MRWVGVIWGLGSVGLGLPLVLLMVQPDAIKTPYVDRALFLPGETTDGHYQIELQCETCHGEGFSDEKALQAACVRCHGSELEQANDSHPQTKFTDPRNADRVAILDARWCSTCHREHRPEITSTMGLSLPKDYCFHCHQDISEERPTHRGLAYDSCANVGCHNFHDNRALYEDFLVAHQDEPALLADPRVPARNLRAWFEDEGRLGTRLGPRDHDGFGDEARIRTTLSDWASSAHARSGVNCSGCHGDTGVWTDTPDPAVCDECHALEHQGFVSGRHGMRGLFELEPMTKGEARVAMTPEQPHRTMTCNSCHPAHDYDTRAAAVTACLGCHADEHSQSYEGTPHHELWERERKGEVAAGSGVSCATCHFPRIASPDRPGYTLVSHNQNDFLRPREKMIRSSCMECHGLAFAIDALADEELVSTNYHASPRRSVRSIDFATRLRWELEGRPPPKEVEAKGRKNGKTP